MSKSDLRSTSAGELCDEALTAVQSTRLGRAQRVTKATPCDLAGFAHWLSCIVVKDILSIWRCRTAVSRSVSSLLFTEKSTTLSTSPPQAV